MKIVVLEHGTSNHIVMIENWIGLCDVNGWDLVVFTNEECRNRLNRTYGGKVKIEIYDSGNIRSLSKILRSLNRNDKLIVNSMYVNYYFYFILFLFHRNSYFTIHNVNKWFYRAPTADKWLKKFLKSIVFKSIYSFSSGIFVNSKNMKDHLRNYDRKKSIFVLPFSLKINNRSHKSIAKLNVVYPGIVCKKRKCYENFIRLAKDFPNVSFILLGKVHQGSLDLLERIDDLNLKNITSFKEYVEPALFDEYMAACNILFSEVNVEYGDEIYGRSKDSGVSYLMSENCLPLIVNKEFLNLPHLHEHTCYFKDYDQLTEKLTIFQNMSQKEYDNLITEIDEARQTQTLLCIAKELKRHFN